MIFHFCKFVSGNISVIVIVQFIEHVALFSVFVPILEFFKAHLTVFVDIYSFDHLVDAPFRGFGVFGSHFFRR